MSLLAVGSIIEAVGKVAGDLITTDKEKMEMEIEQRKLEGRIPKYFQHNPSIEPKLF